MKQTRSSISRLAFEVATCNHRRLVELLSAEYLRPTLRLQAAEFAIQFRDGIAADLTTPIKPTEPDWTRIPWYVRPLAIRKHRRELVQFRHSVELLGSIQSALSLSRDVSTWTSATGYEFEALVAQRFRQHGYDVEQTGGAGDGGIDLEVRRADQRIIVQCKAHLKKSESGGGQGFLWHAYRLGSRHGSIHYEGRRFAKRVRVVRKEAANISRHKRSHRDEASDLCRLVEREPHSPNKSECVPVRARNSSVSLTR